MLELYPPEGRILLHCCCAPCSSAILECMLQNHLDVSVFFSNSNIVPFEEYEHRKGELIRYCKTMGVEYFEDEYDHVAWLEKVAYCREHLRERGGRCRECFSFRLSRSAQFAAHHGFGVLTTSLSSSRWKSLDQINAAGEQAVKGLPVQWWGMNWRKGGLQPRRVEIISEQGFYNQQFCGCEFSACRDSVILYPPAKINLGLNVISCREDGFHDIETLFYPVYALHDELRIEKSEEFSVQMENADWPLEKDLCVRAFRLMQERFAIGNVRLALKKNIPIGAGLGGGSSDCAYTIKGLDALFGLGLGEEQLTGLCSSLGSDCAFFLKARPQWGEGKGDILSDAPDVLEGYDIKVVMPEGESINTALAYKGIKPHMSCPPIREILLETPVLQWRDILHNDFEDSVFPEHPQIKKEKEKLYEQGAVYASMSGSGAAVYGVFRI